ncbi:MAG: hypothetical protein GX651_04190 [Methanomicrobiales archaeon]|nr:hypothetical protein [Methanomicrobiales archaeon]
MDRKLQILLIAGVIITILSLFISMYITGIVIIVVAVLAMSLLIMQDTTTLPDIAADLSDDAKAIIVRNTGNSPAVRVHVSIVPAGIEFDIPSLAADETYRHQEEKMMEEVKVVISFENEKGIPYSRTYRLSALEGGYDPLKPMIPIFGWK